MTINPLIDRFCESRRRWLIVTGVTFVAGLLTVLPLVDQYSARRDRRQDLEEQRAVASLAAEQLPGYAEREAVESQTLAGLEERMVDAQRAPDFRNKLVEIVRESGCQLRRISVGTAKSRPWREGDSPIGATDQQDKPTPFTLEQRSVNLSVSGPTPSIRELLTRVQDENIISHARMVDLRPTGRNRRGVQMDLELWCFALTREPQA